MIRTIQIRSVQAFVREVAGVRVAWTSGSGRYFQPWFRGQTDAGWKLVPSLLRSGGLENESELRSEFQRRGSQLLGGRAPQDEWGWYFLMQHYRSPTRLLDWTDGSLIALFFALNSNDPDKPNVRVNPAVWMLDPWWLNREVLHLDSIVLSDWAQARPYLPKLVANNNRLRRRYPIALDPAHVSERFRVQRSCFTVHGSHPNGLEAIAKRPRARLVRFEIDRRAVDNMRLDLSTCGIGDTTVFPDLEGLSRELARYFSATWFDESGR